MCLKLLRNTEDEGAVNFKALLDEFDGDTEFVKTLTCTFIASSEGFSQGIKSGLKSGDYVKVSEVAHAIKGASGNLRCSPLHKASCDLELYSKSSVTRKRLVTKKANLVLKEIERVVKSIELYNYA